MGNKLLSPSNVLSLASFIHTPVVNLITKVLDLVVLQSIGQKVDKALSDDQLFLDYPVLGAAIRREVKFFKASLAGLTVVRSDRRDDDGEPIGPDEVNGVIHFIKKIYPPAVPNVAEYLDPIGNSIWSVVGTKDYTAGW